MKTMIIAAAAIAFASTSASAQDAETLKTDAAAMYWLPVAVAEERGEYEGRDYSACATTNCVLDFLLVAGAMYAAPLKVTTVVGAGM